MLDESSNHIDTMMEKIQTISQSTEELQRLTKLNEEYKKELKNLNDCYRYQSRESLIRSLEKETTLIRDLKNENQELERNIKDHREALIMIMKKFKDQGIELEKLNDIDKLYWIKDDLVLDREKFLQSKFKELIPLMKSACLFDEMNIETQEKLIAQITKKNLQMKKLLFTKKELIDEDD
ncbi:FGFR1 oncogene partner 2 -like protein [Sarcoptes scabiei]|uniref:FGFR1 oncogene partner 2 -like protein n=2 Tax=Sarcoptes scabiei TaxID=52283 RepID=A0A834R900_SARSC|nr:FGFR1 oncogene partner 2 -like protein [Sarcoptes scabiei]